MLTPAAEMMVRGILDLLDVCSYDSLCVGDLPGRQAPSGENSSRTGPAGLPLVFSLSEVSGMTDDVTVDGDAVKSAYLEVP